MMKTAKIHVCRYMLREIKAFRANEVIFKAIRDRRIAALDHELGENEGMVMPSRDDDDLTTAERETVTQNDKDIKQYQREVKSFMAQVVAHLLMFDSVILWDIDLYGEEKCFGSVELHPFTQPDFDAEEAKHYGLIERESVRKLLESFGFESHSSGGGITGWDLGYSFTQREADRFCSTVWVQYNAEVSTGLIQMLRKSRPRLPGLSNWDDAEAFAKERGIEIKDT